MNDLVKSPSHYTSHPSGVECKTITRWMNKNLGDVFQYIWRCDLKEDALRDLKKARECLNDEIERLETLETPTYEAASPIELLEHNLSHAFSEIRKLSERIHKLETRKQAE